MHLPDELLLNCLGRLDKGQLKPMRLVSRNWCACSTGFLFDTVYISPSEEDVKVFESITQHPLLSKCVQKLYLRWDGILCPVWVL